MWSVLAFAAAAGRAISGRLGRSKPFPILRHRGAGVSGWCLNLVVFALAILIEVVVRQHGVLAGLSAMGITRSRCKWPIW